MEKYMASNSLSKVLYLVSAGFIVLEKKAAGCQVVPVYYWRTALTAVS